MDEASKKRIKEIDAEIAKIEERTKAMTPTHYDLDPSPLGVIVAWDLSFNLGNTIKYISRCGRKAGNTKMADLEKAREYIDREILYLLAEEKEHLS